MGRPRKKKTARPPKRVQVNFDSARVGQLSRLKEYTHAGSYRETLEILIKLGLHVHEEIEAGRDELDLTIVKKLCFT
jgi:hypothetical protein